VPFPLGPSGPVRRAGAHKVAAPLPTLLGSGEVPVIGPMLAMTQMTCPGQTSLSTWTAHITGFFASGILLHSGVLRELARPH
jgi:hypothetical protein